MLWFYLLQHLDGQRLMFLSSTLLIGLGPKFLHSESQPSLCGSPQNLHTSFMWGQG